MAKFRINDRSTDIVPGATLFDLADAAGVVIPASCQRHGSCHECLVEIAQGDEALNDRTLEENFLRGGWRLACRCKVERDGVDVHAQTPRRGAMRIRSEGRRAEYELNPAVTRGPDDTVLIDGQSIAQSTGPILGLAADIGTSSVVVRLIDLEDGRMLADHSFENPQIFGGADVMGRIAYDRDNTRGYLHSILLGYVNRSIDEMTKRLGFSHNDIYECVIAGNATMRDLFFDLDVQGIGQKPFQSLTEREMREGRRPNTVLVERPIQVGLRMHRNGRVYGVPLIACHVGADTAACLAAIAIDREDRTVVLMDIGTNTEVVMIHRGRIICASCPAGPAFEGGTIACGMPGLEGAIERVRIDGEAHYETIGSVPPLGICGSGLIDIIGELLRTDRMNVMGRIGDGQGNGRFWIDRERDLYICDHDLSELAQSKGANIAGLMILIERYGIDWDKVDRFFLAGGFAHHIDVEQAQRIGMLPPLATDRIEKIGNAAIEGATAILCSTGMRARIEALVGGIEHVELEQHPDFFGFFVQGCQYKPSSEMGLRSSDPRA